MPGLLAPSPAPSVPSPAPAPLYTAHLIPLRTPLLPADQAAALRDIRVPIVIDPRSPVLPCEQAQDAISGAVEAVLTGRRVATELRRGDIGGVSVVLGDRDMPVASVALVPVQRQVRAA